MFVIINDGPEYQVGITISFYLTHITVCRFFMNENKTRFTQSRIKIFLVRKKPQKEICLGNTVLF